MPSKAALGAMTRAVAVDCGDRIRVLALEPAATATDMHRTPAIQVGDPQGIASHGASLLRSCVVAR